MRTYDLYVESGPKRRKTMVHVPELLGCIATGPTTEEAIAAAPEAIRVFRRFLTRHGEAVDLTHPFDTRVAQHVTQGDWLGNGSPYLLFETDTEPVSGEEVERYARWLHLFYEALAAWAETQTEAALDAAPLPRGRPARNVLLHVLSPGGYVSAVVGGAPGFSAIGTAAERGRISLPAALRQVDARAGDLLRSSTEEQRSLVLPRANDVRTLRKGIRRMLEHAWEHLAELSRRQGGPRL